MKYTVIFRSGRVETFYVKEVAQMYARTYRGTLITPQMLETFERMANV